MIEGKKKRDTETMSLSKQKDTELGREEGQGTSKNRQFTHGNRKEGRHRSKLQGGVSLSL